jgi:hypothetical protein
MGCKWRKVRNNCLLNTETFMILQQEILFGFVVCTDFRLNIHKVETPNESNTTDLTNLNLLYHKWF